MFRRYFYIIATIITVIFSACDGEDDPAIVEEDGPISFLANSGWKDGRGNGTRANSLWDTTPKADDPAWLYVEVTDKTGNPADPAYFLVRPDGTRPDPDVPEGYTDYHGVYLGEPGSWEEQKKIPYSRGEAKDLTFTAYYYTEGGNAPTEDSKMKKWTESDIPAFGTKDFISSDATKYLTPVEDKVYRDHIIFDLKHRTALLRLSFKVDEKYDKIRTIVLRNVSVSVKAAETTKLGETELTLTNSESLDGSLGLELSTTEAFYACAYIKPNALDPADSWTFKCTYDIYDKDEVTSSNLTRKNVTATNTVTLSNLPAPQGKSKITFFEEGYYYDLNITINPDYLYVLSEHDNKHITIE